MPNHQHRPRNASIRNRLLNNSIHRAEVNSTCGDSRPRLPALSGAEGSIRAQRGFLDSSAASCGLRDRERRNRRSKSGEQQHSAKE